MQNSDLIKKIRETRNLLDNYDISTSIKNLNGIAETQKDFRILDEIKNTLETYKYMASYLIDNRPDESRSSVYADTIDTLRTITDKLERKILSSDSSDSYSETLRYQNLKHSDIETLLSDYGRVYSEYSLAASVDNDATGFIEKLEELRSAIFNLVWISLGDKKIARSASRIVISGNYDNILSYHVISALTLALNSYFDKYKFEALLDIYDASLSETISARALVGIVFSIARHSERIKKIPSILIRLKLMEDSLITYRRVREIVMAIIRTRDTERVANKMKDEVMPELMKLRPDILKKMREGNVDSLDAGIMENNPEWEEILNKSGLTQKMQELSEMQNEGADLMMVAFSNLKQFSFFNTVSNWFLPFYTSHSTIKGGDKDKRIIKKVLEIGKGVCDSDKYSLAIAMSKMPESQKDMMLMQLEAQFDQLSEEIKEKSLSSSAPEFDEETTKVIRDLYRFFKLFRKKEGFNDPFKNPFNFLDLPLVGPLMFNQEIVSLVGEFYFTRGFYSEALSLFNLLLDEQSDDYALWEKIGFCYQSMKFYEQAFEAYSKAELLKTPSKWLLKRLAYVSKQNKDFSKALAYYKRLLENDPDNAQLLVNAGFCAMETDSIDEALSFYYHANYIDPDNPTILRAIAWCEFLNKSFEKSHKYYDKILASSPIPSDYLNIGHLYALEGDFRNARISYKKAAINDHSDFRHAFLSDLPILEKSGLKREDALIILDTINLDL
ncbi:MAG: tetratricopeptide repeat protein [Muribaculaceae bacterium]|nr:tetratricopeptide repeat protein [Muribaculaceae bacterium]